MHTLTFQALRLLADGEFRSGEAIARALGVSRASVWNALHALDGTGIEIFSVRGRGYKLAEPLPLLNGAAVTSRLGARAGAFRLEIHESMQSTNTALLEQAAAGAASGSVIATEWQTGGRGRRGRPWHAGPGTSLTFSLLWRFQRGAGHLAGLSLTVGVAVARALATVGVEARLKWPNDVLWRGGKLAGILIEVQGDVLGPSAAVIGVGINCRLPEAVRDRIDQAVVDLHKATGAQCDRNELLASLLLELERALEAFARNGFADARDEWHARHAHQGKQVQLTLPDGSVIEGVAEGVAEDGSLVVMTHNGRRRLHSGDVRLRGVKPLTSAGSVQ